MLREFAISQGHHLYEPSPADGPLRQGEIISEIVEPIPGFEKGFEAPSVALKRHPYVLVLNQDCDLEWDFESRRGGSEGTLPNILLCEAITAEELKLYPQTRGSDIWKRIRNNKDERYQVLRSVGPDEDATGKEIPELGIDFKKYFTLPTQELYRQLKLDAKRRALLVAPYAHHLTSRFFYYQSRVALPEEH